MFGNIHPDAKPIPSSHVSLFNMWLSPQIHLPLVLRWGPWVNLQGTRVQNTLEHTYGLLILAMHFIMKIKDYLPDLDFALLLHGIAIHDYGEGERRRDIILSRKKKSDDVDEYLAFVARCGDLPELPVHKKAFLLQFALDPIPHFPLEAQEIVADLYQNHRYEAYIFKALENFDYLMYALEQAVMLNKRDCLAQVLKNLKLDSIMPHLPGLDTLWTTEFKAYCYEMAEGGDATVPSWRQAYLFWWLRRRAAALLFFFAALLQGRRGR